MANLKNVLSASVLILIFLLVSCKPTIPSEYIQPADLEDILYDYHIAMSIAMQKGSTPSEQKTYKMAVLKKHGVTEQDFEYSLQYYLRHTEKLHKIYENLSLRLEAEARTQGISENDLNQFGSSMAKGDTADVWNKSKSMVLSPFAPRNYELFVIEADTSFHKGDRLLMNFNSKFIIQDGSCSLCAEVLEPMENSVVLDICAAPGSKSCNIQEITNNQSIIYCNDINNNKIDRIKENVYKCGVENVQYMNFDATILQEDLINKFDRILVDAPCSATGVINKNPEIKLFRTKKDVEDLVGIQRRILENCEKYLKKDGILVYSTCSLLKEENEENVDYIENKLNLKREDIDFYGDKNEFIKLMPFQKGTQGFFISKFVKD